MGIEGVARIVPVISGKGGVGKSTIAVNLAVALARNGYKTALLDSDFYGPSIPTMMGGGKVTPDHEERIVPPSKYGVKYMSLGFFLQHPDDAVIWRGPMFNKALQQMFQDVNWGAVDYMIIDMPPGTGDAQLSLSQLVKLSGAVVVTTPQEVALADVRKAVNMLGKVNVPVIGIVENMSGSIFGEGGGKRLADTLTVPCLAQIPLESSIREGGDIGVPVASADTPAAEQFRNLALKMVEILDTQTNAVQQIKVVN